MRFNGLYAEPMNQKKHELCAKLDAGINAWYAGQREEAMEYAQDALIIARVLGGEAREAEWMSLMGGEENYRSASLAQRIDEDSTEYESEEEEEDAQVEESPQPVNPYAPDPHLLEIAMNCMRAAARQGSREEDNEAGNEEAMERQVTEVFHFE